MQTAQTNMVPPPTMGPTFFFRLLLLINLLTVSFCDDAAVMSKLLEALSPAPSGWSAFKDPCTWTNVNCDKSTGNVVTINLDSQSLSGNLPSEITQLASLRLLSVQINSLSGPLPSFANMSSLEELYLDSNQFSSIPQDFLLGLPNLQTFSISDNGELSPWQIPSYLAESTNLGSFYASNAGITGVIPNFFDSFPNLQNLRLSHNNLTGSLPGLFGSSKIQNLWLNNQQQGLSGTIDVLSSMTQLSQVWLQANAFTGPIPDLSKCVNLFDLQLRDNQLTGVVPVSLTGLPKLVNITLQNNYLQGPKPEFGINVKKNLGNNGFCKDTPGPCDPQVTALLAVAGGLGYPITLAQSWEGNNACNNWASVSCDGQGNVITLTLRKQGFSGTISPALADLTSLRNLYLNGNNLTGSIPESLTSLPHLQVLEVSNNNLSGPIPVFPPSVNFYHGGNLFLGKNVSTDGGSPGSGQNSDAPIPSDIPLSGNSNGSSISAGMIVGVVIAVVIVVMVVFFVSYKCYMKRQHKMKEICRILVLRYHYKASLIIHVDVFLTATGRATNKVDVYAFGVVLMEIITGKKAVDETLPDETCHLVTWFHKIIRKDHNIRNTIDPTLDLDDQTFESISKVAELAAHCTANKYFRRPNMEHVVNVLGPFAQKWKPLRPEEIEEKYGGLDLHMSLPLAFDDSSIQSLSFTEAQLNGNRLNQSAQF
nr:receptor-like kinase TMK4 [Ipomoea batatas]